MGSRAYRDGGVLVPSEQHIAGFHAWVSDQLTEAPGELVRGCQARRRPRVAHRSSTLASRHAEIVLEVGPYVPPHRSYTFPPGT